MPDLLQEVKIFKGIKNDEDIKEIPIDYLYEATNYNFPNVGIQGLEKITMPSRINDLGDGAVDGVFEYRFLDESNKLQVQQIGVCNGSIYKDILTTPVLLRSGISTGKCTFAVLNDKLYIANGKDYVYVYDGAKGKVSQMGAPIAEENGIGILTGTYYWAMTYVTAGGEEILGSVSNTLTSTNKRIDLTLPIGYAGVTSRKIYRTEAGGSTLKLLTTIADNTTLTYTDNIVDAALGVVIGSADNELPKPYFIAVFNERLIGAKVDLYPTQVFISDTEIDMFDLGNGLDIANYADDNSPVEGLGIDFSNVIVGTTKHIYIISVGTSITVTTTRVNIGIKDGYSVKRIPTFGNFNGGLMFVSSNNDVRVLVGLRALPVSTSVDNIFSENFAQNIRGTLINALKSPSNIYAEYFNYKYHLIIDGNKYVFDIRTNGWTYHEIQTENYKSSPLILGLLGDYLYNGQVDGWIEQEYKDIQYRDEEVIATIKSPNIFVSTKYKAIQKFIFWFLPSADNELDVEVIADDDRYLTEDATFNFIGGSYDELDYDEADFETGGDLEYKVFNVHRNVRWIRFILRNTKGNIIFSSWGVVAQPLKGKE